ncbi:MAG: hypothetical protein R3E18_04920 [Sphingomonadaceae bacterium]|nr:hypothetical protein [Sphingomonadaceae bacterium]
MAVVFLIGGTGNQLFQFTRAAPRDRFCTLFLQPALRRWLGWKDHEQVLRFPAANPLACALALPLLALDVMLAKLAGRSLYTRLDLRGVKASPILTRWVQVGYFQNAAQTRNASELGNQLAAEGECAPALALHIRGGDALAMERQGAARYGILPAAYFRAAFGKAGDPDRVHVFTDDPAHARAICAEAIPDTAQITYDSGDLSAMMRGCLSARRFIACNSTLSWWLVQMRGAQRPSIVPSPFTLALDLPVPPGAEAIHVDY